MNKKAGAKNTRDVVSSCLWYVSNGSLTLLHPRICIESRLYIDQCTVCDPISHNLALLAVSFDLTDFRLLFYDTFLGLAFLVFMFVELGLEASFAAFDLAVLALLDVEDDCFVEAISFFELTGIRTATTEYKYIPIESIARVSKP